MKITAIEVGLIAAAVAVIVIFAMQIVGTYINALQ